MDSQQKNLIPDISVIMPIYNTAPYLRDALNSICNQTLRNLQIILVDDGSTDASPDIMSEYASRDDRIICLKQPNSGQGAARNRGLQRATGKYIYFMDSDDVLEKDCLQTCFDWCERERLDYVTFDARVLIEYSQTKTGFDYDRSALIDSNHTWQSMTLLEHTLHNGSFRASVWLFLIRRTLITNADIRFPEGIIHEDNLFVLLLMLQGRTVRYLPTAYFLRRVRESSTMTSRFSMRNVRGYLTVGCAAASLSKKHPEWREQIDSYLRKTLDSVVWQGHQLTLREKFQAASLFIRYSLAHYASLRSWAVFWLKR